ncbi:uncharacterized protein NFIA_057400 [Aspergillus fischeri NRRL 181]|uniref:Uncharacterized protein n=1 Tax=Neosartorya fischeri (strain ATCC 1020 / DSM 3700 / CBS 544.65 / FGSC A1164 / JCM 1740 / NRRL 181 / WB 181) TaxID=331117 RepID=A1DNM0_NEOFI|nr:uncharacterized protein NFIA_057400 [Aspergillus fischeri NRRL 181]EAW16391.1 hypothetical protein NFIA_057400 [Aspergillus fischeri NRRL 181]
MPRGRPRVHENDEAPRQVRNQRRRQRRRKHPSVVEGLDPDFGHTLISAERTGYEASSRGYAGLRMLRMNPEKATGALAAFYEKIHIWYPILPLGFPGQYSHILSGMLAPSAESCLALLVAVQDEERRSRANSTSGRN